MITSFQQQALNRDLDQISKWVGYFQSHLPPEIKQDLLINGTITELVSNVDYLRVRLENKTGAYQ